MASITFRSKMDGCTTYLSTKYDKQTGHFHVQVDSVEFNIKTKDMRQLIEFFQQALADSMKA